MTDEELSAFCAFAESLGENGKMFALTARLAYLTTGQRRGNLLRLRLDQLHEDGILITQSKTRAKVLIEWTLALHDCISSLRALPRPVSGMFLICNRSGQIYTDSGFKAMWRRVITSWANQGNERFYFHDLRAKAITKMVEDGRQARDLSGHKTDSMVAKIYDRRLNKTVKSGRINRGKFCKMELSYLGNPHG